MKSIVFFTYQPHLTFPTWFEVAKNLKNYNKVLIDEGDVSGHYTMTNPQMLEAKKHFDQVISIKKDPNFGAITGIYSEYRYYLYSIKQLKKKLAGMEVSAFIFPTDLYFFFRVCKLYFPYSKRIVIQPGFKRILPADKSTLRRKAKALIANYFLRVPLFRPHSMFGKQDTKAHYIFWTKRWCKSIPNEHPKYIYFLNGVPSRTYFLSKQIEKNNNLVINELSQLAQINIDDHFTNLVCIVLNKRISVGQTEFEKFAHLYLDLIKAKPEWFFLIKIHPLEDASYCTKLYSKNLDNNILVISDGFPVEHLIEISSLVLTQWSTVIMQSLLSSTPTVLVNPDGRHDMTSWFVGDYPFISSDLTSLTKHCDQALKSKYGFEVIVKDFVNDSFGSDVTGGASRAAELIQKISSSCR